MGQSGSPRNQRRRIVGLSHREEELVKGLYDAVVAMDEARVRALSMSVLTEGVDTNLAVRDGLMAAMEKAGELYTSDVYYVSELLLCADALHAGLEILIPHASGNQSEKKRQIIIGTVEGDIHDVGKNIVKTMFEATGWQVHDLGKDVGPQRFVDEQTRIGADIIALSALMTTSMLAIPKAIGMIKAAHPEVAVMVGGAPLTRDIALGYGADGYAKDAGAAVAEAKATLARR
jgi:methanogenic corrinoid protein MtbC1